MSLYFEIPELNPQFPFRTFMNTGQVLVYPHWHKELEFIYVTKGTVRIGVNDQVLSVGEGEIYFFDSGETHYFLASPDSDRIVYQFDLKLFNENALDVSYEKKLAKVFTQGENHSSNWPKAVEKQVQEILNQLYLEQAEQKQGSYYATKALLYQLVVLFSREIPQKDKDLKKMASEATMKNQDSLERLDQVFSYIENNYEKAITLEEIAGHVGFSPHYFTRFFKKNTGMTFVHFLTEYRISMAKYILGNETIPMIEVAEKSGFNSVKTFHHVFKEEVGVSPLKYQKSISGNN